MGFYIIADVLILGVLIFFLSGNDEVDWQKLVLMVLLLVMPVGIISGLLGTPVLKSLASFCAIFAGLMFVMKIQPKKALTIMGVFLVIQFGIGLLIS